MLPDAPLFQDEHRAYEYFERQAWPHGPRCPRCNARDRIGRMTGTTTRIGTYKCYRCRKPFTVKIGTILQNSHLPLHCWLKAIYLLSFSAEEIGARELQEVLEVTSKAAAGMVERLNASMIERRRTEPSEAAP